MRRGSSKPCPGCGKVVDRRPADKLCWKCSDDLDSVPVLRTALDRCNSSKVLVAFGEMSYWNQYFRTYERNGNTGDKIRRLFHELAKSISTPLSGTELLDRSKALYLNGKTDGGPVYAMATEESATALINLHSSMQSFLDVAYKAGYQDGRNLLVGLSNGSISIEQFNEKTK